MASELSDVGFARLVDAIADAPLVPEWAVDRVADDRDAGTAFVALRWDTPVARRAKAVLTPKQLDAVQQIADGRRMTDIAGDDRRNLFRMLRGAANRLGATSSHQTIAIAVALGLVEVKQHYALGPAFRVSGAVCRSDRQQTMLAPALRRVLVGICNGMTNQEIADEHNLSPETIKSQVTILLQRYGAKSRAQLAALAVRHGHVY